MTWIKAPSKGRYYPGGFDSAMQLTGSPYNAPARTAPVFSSGVEALFSGGGLSESVNYNMELQKSLGYAAGRHPKLCQFDGGFQRQIRSGSNDVRRGIARPGARGFFLGTNISGAVLLQGN